MPDYVPRPPKAPPEEPLIKGPDSYIRIPPDFFPPKPDEGPELPVPPDQIRRPPIAPPRPYCLDSRFAWEQNFCDGLATRSP